MKIPQIQLQQTYAKIGIRITKPVQDIEQPPAQMSIKQEHTKMVIDRKPGTLEIDQEQARNEVNLKSPSVLSDDFAQFGRQQLLEAIDAIVQRGNRMAAIKNKADAIVAMATEQTQKPPPDFNIGFIPSYGSVKFDYTPTELQIDWQIGGTQIEILPQKPIHHYKPGKAEVFMSEWPELKIDVLG
ncbi:DUF6470 family protein [Bacillus marasmi]|uniref:DUF6470 family protein n=1 Tax=Bacillus marasmi TaxID=1926279 RepID=UPI0011C78C4A|nr:DUF6470 family protein [Bacillus marasmi]